MSQEADILPILSTVLALWSDVGYGSGLRKGVCGEGVERSLGQRCSPATSCCWGSPGCWWWLWLAAPWCKGLGSGTACFSERGTDLMTFGSHPVEKREKGREWQRVTMASATVFQHSFKSEMAHQARLLPPHPVPLQLLLAPLCSRVCGNLAPIPSLNP